jgi:hypothetical protein
LPIRKASSLLAWDMGAKFSSMSRKQMDHAS